jgi:hypothetical protein
VRRCPPRRSTRPSRSCPPSSATWWRRRPTEPELPVPSLCEGLV